MSKKLFLLAMVVMLVGIMSQWAVAEEVEFINGCMIVHTEDGDGNRTIEATTPSGQVHVHALPFCGFWGFVYYDLCPHYPCPCEACVTLNFCFDGDNRSSQDTYSCPACGFYCFYLCEEGGYNMMAVPNGCAGNSGDYVHGYRCADELIRQDFYVSWLGYVKICPYDAIEEVESAYTTEIDFSPHP